MTTTAIGTALAGGVDDVLLFGSPASAPASISTPAVIAAMLDSGDGISDLIFSPGRPPQAFPPRSPRPRRSSTASCS